MRLMSARFKSRYGQLPPRWLSFLWDTPWLWVALVLALSYVPLFAGLGRTDLDSDEAIYSFAVETMLEDGDWLTPKSIPSTTSAFLEKPPLKFWITATPIRAGWLPLDEFGLRFMDAALGALALLYVFGIGRRLSGPVCGLVAVFVLLTHNPLLFNHGLRSNNMESTTVLAYAAGVYHFLAWRSINPDVKRHVFAMALWFVLAFMTKFVAAAFLPAVLGGAAMIKREDRGRLYRDWRTFAVAAAVAIALILPWFIYQYYARGPRMIDIMFGAHVVKRFTAYLDPAHLHPWHYYFTALWHELGISGTKWLVAGASVLFVLQTIRQRWIDGAVVVLWFVLPVVAISAGTSKLYHYVFPFLPPLGLAAGWLIAVVARRLFAWLERPVEALVRGRDSLLPGRLSSPAVGATLSAAGAVLLIVAAATAALDRIHLAVGPVDMRNSSVARPLAAAMSLWLIGAPGHLLRAIGVFAIAAAVLPWPAYRTSLEHATMERRPLQSARACLTPIVRDEVARGAVAPGTVLETRDISYVPFYYLREFGRWQPPAARTDKQLVRLLIEPGAMKPVMMTSARFSDIERRFEVDRPAFVASVAAGSGFEPAVVEAALESAVIGITSLEAQTLVLPGPYASCGVVRRRLISPAG